VSNEQVVGYFKGIIEIESKEDKVLYRQRKKELIEDLIRKLKKISNMKMRSEMEIDIDKLGCAIERRAFENRLRNIDVGHLNISTHLANLESDEILKRGLLA